MASKDRVKTSELENEIVCVDVEVINIEPETPEGTGPESTEDGPENICDFTKIWSEIKQFRTYFTWTGFFYFLVLGLLPTAWDIQTDLTLGSTLTQLEDEYTAGLCYIFICLPGIHILHSVLVQNLRWRFGLTDKSSFVLMFVLGLGLTTAVFACFWIRPHSFAFPAILISVITLITKALAVIVHGPETQKLSLLMSTTECRYESGLQLLLLLHIWLSGGKMFLSAMVSSILVISKVGIENYFAEDMKIRSKVDKLKLTARYLPLFAVTTLHKLGSVAVTFYSPYPLGVPLLTPTPL